MTDPFAHYTPTGDRLLLLTPADHRRAWLAERIDTWLLWIAATAQR